MAKLEAAQSGGFITGRGPRAPRTRLSPSGRGQALLEIHAAFQAENSAQHSLATDKNTQED